MNEYTLRGEFSGSDCAEKEKRAGGKAWMGKVNIIVDNSYTVRGEVHTKLDTIPFDAYGRVAEDASKIGFGQSVEITFRLEGREWQGKHYATAKLIGIKEI